MTDAAVTRSASVSLAPTRAGLRGRLLNLFLRSYFKRRASKLEFDDAAIAEVRHRLEALSKKFSRPAPDIAIGQTQMAGVPVEIVEPAAPAGDRPLILYFHGGAFVAGSPRSHHGITRALARLANARLVVPDYRLAPEHLYPAQLDDALAVYAHCLERVGPRSIVFAGDSAGGNLVLATLIAARDRSLPMPAAAVALSPWADLTGSGESVVTMAAKDAMLPAAKLAAAARAFAGETDLRTPTVSPLFGDYDGLPPLLLHVGTTEILRDDSVRVHERALAAGVQSQLRMWRSLPHVFHVFSDYLPAARVALAEVAAFVSTHIERTAPAPASGAGH